MPKVSCIIPVYNGERFLQETLESVLGQTHPLHEVLVVDDGSTDGTRAVVEAVQAKYGGPIRYLWQENAGAAVARNTGLAASEGEFISFLDADDLWHPEKIARQLQRFAARPELGISVTYIQNFWLEEVREEEERMRGQPRAQPVAGYVMGTLLARRAVFEQVGPLNATLRHADSAEWFMRAQDAQVINELLPEVLVMRRMHSHNSSRLKSDSARMEYFHLLKSRARASSQSANRDANPSASR